MLTVESIIAACTDTKPFVGRHKCLLLSPPLKLRRLAPTPSGRIAAGEIVTADSIDIGGSYPNTVHLREKGYWWDIEFFELVEQPSLA